MVVHKIEAKKPQQGTGIPVKRLLKVAAYCRVSTEQDEQQNSYEAQIEHYNSVIAEHKDWLNAGIYADKGISGTMAKKRPEFLKMIKHCRQHKIDLILVKSISRFARNTVDCLEYIRELKALGIGVIFEKENINTLTETSEAMITIMGYFAQAESESISKNVTWGVRHAFAEGRVTFTCDIYGYHKVGDGVEIVEEEAKIIREIFEKYYAGESPQNICNSLNERGIPTPSKKGKWVHATIQTILRNEKYKGDVITQKTYCSDLLTHKRVKNTGQLPQHYITDHHAAIVDRDLFDRVQAEYARRTAKKKITYNTEDAPQKSKYSSKYALTELLVCGDCGCPYRRCTWVRRGEKRIVWRCTTRIEYGKSKCGDAPTLDEDVIHKAILKALSSLVENKDEVKDELKVALGNVLIDTGTDLCIAHLEAQLKEQENDMMRVVRICAERGNQKEFEGEFKRINANITELRQIIEVEKTKIRPTLDIESRLDRLFEQITAASADMENFENSLIRQLVAQVRVESAEELTIILHNGFRTTAKI